MTGAYFKPWIGKKFGETKLLIMSESAYSWRDKDGKVVDPPPSHPTDQVLHWIDHFGEQKYYTTMGRALCGTNIPTNDKLKRVWNECAYTIFVQGTVGEGWNSRPSETQWKNAALHFIPLIEKIRPLKVIVTGKTMWNGYMPDCNGPHLSDDIQSYKLSDDTLVWCLAVHHPSRGIRWEEVGEKIRVFRSIKCGGPGCSDSFFGFLSGNPVQFVVEAVGM